ncbi:uncharacterized protein LOC112171146 [Rosa chinensis]|uniref:uncharacterized protein LOC112171146 n=1 Tax=Rosa chinensis TaxID=74649 RepID=UPI000D09010D|nr:uncharacterized protein LOC112171146 [Rosa chinensis]
MWRLSGTVEVQPPGERFLFTFTHERDIARVKKSGPWGFQGAMILLNDYDGFSDISAVKLDFVWIWVTLQGIPLGLLTEHTIRLVGGTIGEVLEVDRQAPKVYKKKGRPWGLRNKVKKSPSVSTNGSSESMEAGSPSGGVVGVHGMHVGPVSLEPVSQSG